MSFFRCARMVMASAAVVWLAVAGFANDAAAQKTVPGSAAAITLSFAPLVKQAAPAVVNVFTRKAVAQRVSPLFEDPFFRRFFGDAFPPQRRERIENSLGSGVIVQPDGLIARCLSRKLPQSPQIFQWIAQLGGIRWLHGNAGLGKNWHGVEAIFLSQRCAEQAREGRQCGRFVKHVRDIESNMTACDKR